jgi:hypothetical protein
MMQLIKNIFLINNLFHIIFSHILELLEIRINIILILIKQIGEFILLFKLFAYRLDEFNL